VQESDSIPWLLVAARFFHWGTCLLLFGTLAYEQLIYRPVGFRAELPRSLWRITVASYLGAVVSGVIWFWAIGADMGGDTLVEALDPEFAATIWNETQVGQICHWRLVIALLLGANLALISWKRESAWLAGQATCLAGAWVGSLAFTGHGLVGPGLYKWAHLGADVLHTCLSALWPGGLLPLWLTLRYLGSDSLSFAARLVRRFSVSAVICVSLLMVTGLVNSFFLLGSVHNLLFTNYGQLLTIKLGLFLGMIGLGAVNLLWLSPRIIGQAKTITTLSYVVAVEVVATVLLLGVISLLGLTEPVLSK
jgi:putative copper resistance protein D